MPTKKRKYEARFPTARIKKIMQTDEEIGKVAAAVPVIISRALEIFLQQLVMKTSNLTAAKRAKTMTTGHLKQCIESETQFDFLKDLVSNIADMPNQDEEENADSGETKAKKPRKKRAPGERKKLQTKKTKKSSSSNDSDDDDGSDDQDEEAIAPKNGSVPHQNNGGKTFPLSTSTVSKPPSSQPIIENATASLQMPSYQPTSSLPMILQSTQHEDEDDYDEDD